MTRKAELENLVKQKTMLAEKYDRLIKTISSKPRRERYRREAAKFRRQVADCLRAVKHAS